MQNNSTGEYHIYENINDTELAKYLYKGYFKLDYSRLFEDSELNNLSEIEKSLKSIGYELINRTMSAELFVRYGIK